MKQISLSNFNRLRMAGALTLAIVLLSTTLQAATYYVTPTGAGAKNGTSWDNAFGNIQLAIDKAIADSTDEVWVKQGIYKPLALYSPSNANSLTWKSGVNVYGGFAGNETDRSQRSLDAKLTVLDGDNVSRTAILQGFNTFKTLTTWSSFTLQNGVSPYYGGIYMYRNMAIDHFIIKDCTNNASGNQSGGGVYITLANAAYTPTDSIIIRNSRIEGNKANYGGGIAIGTASYNTNTVIPTVLIENTEIINNRAAVRGGGIMIEAKAGSEKNVVIRNCVIANNTSGDNVGGGLSVFKVDVEVINTTFANNVAGNWGGGGLYANSVDSLMVTNSIFWNNKDIENGTGSHTILSQGKGLVDSVVIIRNCAFGLALQVGTDVTNNAILENNITLDTLNDGSESGKSYIRFTSPSIAAGYRAGDTSKIADWSLAAGSAAIDAGATVAGLNADIVGRSRPVGSHYDIGAYEYAEPIVIASGATENTAYTQNHGDVVFDAGAGSAGYWTATTPVTNGAIRLVKTFETEKTYAIGFPFAVASVSATEYELKQYDGEANMFGAAYSMEAGKGYLIKFPASLGASVTVTFTSVRNPTLAAAPSLNTGEYALVANGTLQNATSIAGAQNYYPLNSDGTFGAAGSSIVGGLLNPFEAVLATAATADLLPSDSIGAGNDATPTVTLTADNGISVVTPKGITYPYKTVEQFITTFKVASGYTNIRAIVTTEGTSKLDTIPLTTSDTIYTATFSRRAGHTLIRLAADTIRSTVTVNADGVEELSMASGTRVGYFDNVWITFKVRDGYHSPRVAAGSTYKDVKKGANGVDTVFLGAVAANVTVNIAAFRDNTAPVLYDAQVANAAAASVVVNTTNTTMQLLKNPPTALPYAYVKFDVADAVEGDDYEMIRLRLMTNMVQFASAKELQLQWVSNNLSDGVTPWDNSNFAYDSTTVKDTVSLITVANGQSIVEFIIDNPATIAQIKDSIAAGNRQLSFRVSLNTTDVAGMIVLYTSEGARGSVNDLLNRTPQLIFSKAEYPITVINESGGLVGITSPSAADTTYKVQHDSSLVLSLTVKKGYEPVAKGYGKFIGTPSITSDTTYTFEVDKARSRDTIRLSADVIRFNVEVLTPNGHITIIEPAEGRSPYRVANDSSFTLAFTVDMDYIPSVTVSNDPSYSLGDTVPGGYYAVTLPRVTSDVTITVAADETDSVTVSVTKPNNVTITSPRPESAAYRVARDSSLTLALTLVEGYEISVKVNGIERSDLLTRESDATYTFTVPKLTASISVAIETSLRKYSVVLLAEDGVTVTGGASTRTVDHGSSLSVSVTLADGYFSPVDFIRLDGSNVRVTSETNGVYTATIGNIKANDSIRITADNGKRYITIRKDERVTLVSSSVNSTDTVQEAQLAERYEVVFKTPAGYTPTVTLQSGATITTLPEANEENTYRSYITGVSDNATIIITLTAPATGIAGVDANDPVVSVRYYNLQGQEVRHPAVTGIYILHRLHLSGRTSVEKTLIKADQ